MPAVNLGGLEHARKAHRRAHAATQVAAAQHHLVLGLAVAGHAAEGHHQAVEIAAAGCGVRREQPHELEVHGQRRYEARGHCVGGVAAAHAEAEHGRRRLGSAEIVRQRRVDGARAPVAERTGGHEFHHLVGRVAHGVERPHDGTHGGARHEVDGDIVLLQRLDDANMGDALGSAAAQHQAYALARAAAQGYGRRHHCREHTLHCG